MSFRFSVGDFLAVGKLIVDVGLSLRDIDGSASQYQELHWELDSLQRALQYVCLFEPRGDHKPRVDETKLAVSMCRYPFQDFLNKIQGYEGSLGTGRSKGKVLDWKNKVQWMISKKKE